MSTVNDFNRIEDCNKIDAQCVDAYNELSIDGTTITSKTSWGEESVDIKDAISDNQTLTKLSLSPEDLPNCLVYEPEYGENNCITGDELSRIVSLTKLKDVSDTISIANGDTYVYNGVVQKFEPFALLTVLNNALTAIENLDAGVASLQNGIAILQNRLFNLENTVAGHTTLLTKPTGTPNGAGVVWGNINVYADTNAVVDLNGVPTSLDKTHGLYTHDTSINAYGDELFS